MRRDRDGQRPPAEASRIVRFAGVYAVFSTLLVLAVAALVGWLAQRDIEESLEGPLLQTLGGYVSTLESGTINGRAMGAAILFGLENRDAKQLAAGRLPPDAPSVLAQLKAMRTLYLAEAVQLLNKHGKIVASADDHEARATGADLSRSPYVQRALQGTPNVYPAVDLISGTRGIFLCAPLHAEARATSPVVGAVVIKVGADKLDRLLKTWTGGIALLVSPQGIVFAASRDDWRFRSQGNLSGDRLADLRRNQQFGTIFDAARPVSLPFAMETAETSVDGASYAVRRLPVEWGDPGGDWVLTFMERRAPWWNQWQVLGGGWLAGLIAALLLSWYYFTARNTAVLNEMNIRLQNSDELLKESQRIAGLGTYRLDVASGTWESSAVLDRVFGIDGKFVRSIEGWGSLLHPDDRERMIAYLRDDVIGHGRDFNREYRIVTHDRRQERWVHGLGRLEFDAAGRVVEMHGTIQDITERKRAEEELRTSLRLLEEKELAKSRFLAAAGHDLRQPLAAATLFIEALNFARPTPEQQKIIGRLEQAMTTFSGLLDALLNISRLDAGVIKPENQSINVMQLVKWLERNLAPLAADKRLAFKVHVSGSGDMAVCSDIGLLQQVLMNLVSNAIKFTAHGGVLISIRRRGDHALFQVWDTGIGIEPGHLEHIFDEFYQVNNPQRDRASGLGLGLSIVKRAIALLGSAISCQSRPGRGSVFGFRLPLECMNDAAAAAPCVEGAPAPEESPAENVAHGKRFVVVEDDTLVAQGLISWLESMGGQVARYHNAEDALRIQTVGQADYYIVDYMLSGPLNGIQFLNRLHDQLGRPIKAVLLTGDTSPSFVRDAARLLWPVLHKPVQTSRLLATLGAQTA